MGTVKRVRLFGTDGIRAQAGRFPLSKESVLNLGDSLGEILSGSEIIIARDTRESGTWITQLLVKGIAGRVRVSDCGVIPTPGISYLVRKCRLDFGIMITASHNHFSDNGIKILNQDGEKISQDLESQIEAVFYKKNGSKLELPDIIIRKFPSKDLYRDFLINTFKQLQVGPEKVVIDCANGATAKLAPEIFHNLGFNTIVINAQPNGENINERCGSTHMDALRQVVLKERAAVGISYDGDGDRVMFVDNKGNILTGDHVLYLLAMFFKSSAAGFNNIVVGTVLTNLGLEKTLDREGIKLLRSRVGDKFVYEKMVTSNSVLGGEQSGHIIVREYQKSGDGILTSLYFLKALKYLDWKVSDVYRKLHLYPQVIKNITITYQKDLDSWGELNALIDEFNQKYSDSSRILIRYSGTEPKVRVMMESANKTIIKDKINEFCNLIKSEIGGDQ